jgi:hypothetical protein
LAHVVRVPQRSSGGGSGGSVSPSVAANQLACAALLAGAM